MIDYILSAYHKSQEIISEKRINISPNEPAEQMRTFFEKVLDIRKAPIGKWPAKFMPALMQQTAVNLAIQKGRDEIPVFSVNGPPGTGKTTLLKEIIANNVVERARLLAEYADDPDAAFDRKNFSEGPLEDKNHAYYRFAPNYYELKNDAINDYGMLVTSCNNAAVENITADLPKAGELLHDLASSPEDPEAVRAGLQEVCDLFDIEKTEDIETIRQFGKSRQEKDIYFTRYANSLLGTQDCWGLISAPFGKRSNIRKYCNSVLKPLAEEYGSNDSREQHKKKFRQCVEQFNRQLQLVESLKEEIGRLAELSKNIGGSVGKADEIDRASAETAARIQATEAEIRLKQQELIQLEESRPKGLFGFRRQSSTREELISELKQQIEALKQTRQKQQTAYDSLRRKKTYQELRARFSSGENELAVIDPEFMEAYGSADEKISTKAQVTNPWFTPKYNRERENFFFMRANFIRNSYFPPGRSGLTSSIC